MSEQHQHHNWPHRISPEIHEEKLRMNIPVIAPALLWVGVIGNLQLSLRHPRNNGPSRQMIEDFARDLLTKLADEKVFTQEQGARAFQDFQKGE